MKKTILLWMALLTVPIAAGRSPQRFSCATSIGTALAMSEPASTPLLWRITAYYTVGDRFSVGAGTGLSFYEKTLIPLYGDVRLLLFRPRRFTPYLQVQTGYSFAPAREARGGFFLAPSIGVRYAFRNGMCVFLAAGYESQRLERLKTYVGSRFSAQFAEQLRHRGIAVRIGMQF